MEKVNSWVAGSIKLSGYGLERQGDLGKESVDAPRGVLDGM